jgi:molybdopterin-binding protein
VSEAVARFVGVETLLACRVRAVADGVALLEAGSQTIEVAQPAAPGEWVRLCIRPEDVTLSARPEGAPSSARNHLDGQVVRVVPSGAHVRVTIDCGFPLVALVTRRSAEELGFVPGRQVTAHFKATAPHLLRHAKP